MLRFLPVRVAPVVGVVLVVVVGLLAPGAGAQQREERDLRVCERTSLGLVPLTDLATATHEGFQGGLYPGGSNEVPADHLAAGLEAASRIVPRNATGAPDDDGKVGFISVGVSNAKNKFRRFMDIAPASYELDPQLVLVNGAQGGKPIQEWRRVTAGAWDIVDDLLADASLTPEQVQAAWVMLPEIRTDGVFPDHALGYQAMLEEVLRTMKIRYPNLQVAYLSSRNYAGYGQGLSTEPYAYEMAFSIKWIIERQIAGEAGTVAGSDMPWLRWGPYTWADGLGPDGVEGGVPGRSDGLEWTCDEVSSDGIHPSGEGATKTAHMLADHLASDPTAVTWFLASGEVESTTGEAPESPVETTTTTTETPAAAPSTTVQPGAGGSDRTGRAQPQPREESRVEASRELPVDRPEPSWPLVGGVAAVLAVGLGLVARARAADRVRNGRAG